MSEQADRNGASATAFMQRIAESSSDGIVCADLNGEIRFLNRKAREILGYSNAEIVGQPVSCLIPEETIAAHSVELSGWADTGRLAAASASGQIVAASKNGGKVDIHLTLSGLQLGDRSFVVALLRDLSKQEASGQRLRLLRAAFEAAPNSTVVVDLDGRIQWANPAFGKMTGYSIEEVIGEGISILKSDQQDQSYYADLWQTVLAGETWRGMLINRKKNGTFYLEQQAVTPVLDDSGVVECFVAVKEDVTDAVQLQQDLREAHDRYRVLFESSPLALFVEDFSAVKSYIDKLLQSGVSDLAAYFTAHPAAVKYCASMIQIVDVNQAAIEMAGVGSKNALLGSLEKIFSATSYEQLKNELIWLAEGNCCYVAEVQNSMPGGERLCVDLRLTVSPVSAGSWSLVIVSLVDVTEKKRRQKRMAHGMKMEAIGRLASGIAHDFNNVLTVISGNLHLIMDSVGREIGDDAMEMITDVLSAADDGGELTTRLLAFSRPSASSADRAYVDKVILDMARLVKHVLGSGIDIKTEISDQLAALQIDKSALGNALMNLAINAKDAMRDGGVLSLRARNGAFDPVAMPGQAEIAERVPCVVVEVVDCGAGMSADVLDKATEPFFTTKKIDAGNGLGLSMVQDFTDALGGRLKIASTVGVGTTVTLFLPLASGSK